MVRSLFTGATAAAALLVLGVAPAQAQLAPGSTLDFMGTADVIHTEEHDLFLVFGPGGIASRAPGSGSFAALGGGTGGVTGRIRDFEVVVGPQPLPGFVTLGGYTFDLVGMIPGTSVPDACLVDPLPGQRCTPPRHDVEGVSTPFTLVNMASGNAAAPINSMAWFDVYGMVRGPGGGVASPFTGRFEASFTGLSYQEVLYGVETTGLQGVQFSGRFTTAAAASTVPEPSAYALVATGLVGLAGAARARRRR